MDSSFLSGKLYSDDADILEMLVELSDASHPQWNPQFPYLDPFTVSQASRSISTILSKDKSRLRKQIILLVRKLCSGSGTCLEVNHGSWIGRSLSLQESVHCLIDVCFTLIKDEKDWAQHEPQEQLAVSYAVLNAATNKPVPLHPKAGTMCNEIVCRILDTRKLTRNHHHFLARVWEYSAELPIDTNVLVRLAECSALCLESSLLWLGKTAISGNFNKLDYDLQTSHVSNLIRVCCQSCSVFQTVSRILSHMMVISEAHCGIQDLIKSLMDRVEAECAKEGCDASALYNKPCQIVAALMCIDPSLLPETGKDILSQEHVTQLLLRLPREMAASLLSHKTSWLPFVSTASSRKMTLSY